jgi:hypothetical protein
MISDALTGEIIIPAGSLSGKRITENFGEQVFVKSNYFLREQAGSAVCYPWAMAPTINTTKVVATAIATFVSTDKFIIFPFNYGFFGPFEFQRADGCQTKS